MSYLPIIALLSLLVIIHEFGHYLVARAFGMRVVTYSIGFGPVIAKWRPRGSETVFQIGAIPMLAYVQVAGTNPREPNDPSDRGSYQNARPLARFLMIAAGPLANYLAACLLVFGVAYVGGQMVPPTHAIVGHVMAGSPAAGAGLQEEDTVRAIDGHAIGDWHALQEATRQSHGMPLALTLDRHGATVNVRVTPRHDTATDRYLLGIESRAEYAPVGFGRALALGVTLPPELAVEQVQGLAAMVRGKIKVELAGPIGIVHESAQQAKDGWRSVFNMGALISLSLFVFNLLPIPALDGGRLIMLGYEMVMRRRIDPRIEQRVLAVSMTFLLCVFAVVSARDVWRLVVPH